jgi:catechol 2,3-dioxygenase
LSREDVQLSDSDIFLEYPEIVVKDIDVMLSFYREYLGMTLLKERGQSYFLSASNSNRPLLSLIHNQESVYSTVREAGLYHFAILLPRREDLASTFLFLQGRGLIFDGFADHLVSEAVYLHDPEGNGIEIYADKPRETWPFTGDGMLQMTTLPLNISSLLEIAPSKPRPLSPDARIGHFHLKVTKLEDSVEFYSRKLLLDVKARMYGAAFLSLGGYHHHFGLNTWETLGGIAKRNNTTGLVRMKLSATERYMRKAFGQGAPEMGIELLDPDNLIIEVNPKGF